MARKRAKNLLIDQETLNRAEGYCRELGTPMSRLIEDFLESMPQHYKSEISSPIVQRLYGATSRWPMRPDDYRDYLYGRRERKRPPSTSRG